MSDKHDLNHNFQRFDTPAAIGVHLPSRTGSPKKLLLGMFVGAKVQRGKNWEWADQDGGPESCGRIVETRGWDNETWRSVVNVTWASGLTNIYRVGHKGKVDLRCIELSNGGTYYPLHLALLGKKIEEACDETPQPDPCVFSIGEKVKVNVDAETLHRMQDGHGGWNPRMVDIVGVVGRVHRLTDKGDIRVLYQSMGTARWTLNPRALIRVREEVSVGDLVKVSSDKDAVIALQKGHGEWIHVMSCILGKTGKVVKVYSDGDLRVSLEGQIWTLNPLSVQLVSEGTSLLAPEVPLNTNVSNLLSDLMDTQLDLTITLNIDRIVRAAAQGHLEIVNDFFTKRPNAVDVKSNGKSCLQVAAHQGHMQIVRLLVGLKANIGLRDDEDDTALHYAAFGNQPAVMEYLLESGADVNSINANHCTPLHVSVSKKHIGCVRVVLKHFPDLNLQDSYGDTALHDAIGNDMYEAVELLTRESSCTDLTLRNKRGFNCLHHAALKGNNRATERLLTVARDSVDVRKDDGFSALHLAAFNGHAQVVSTLLMMGGATVDLTNNRGQTALMLASSQGHATIVEVLVKKGCSLTLADKEGDTAVHTVLTKRANNTANSIDQNSAPNVFKLMTEIKTMLEELEESTEHVIGIAIAAFLVQEGSSLEAVNSKGKTPLNVVEDTHIGEILNKYVLSEEERERMKSEKKNVECFLCSELSVENCLLEPCGHRVACEDCSARLKKCFKCQVIITRRIGADGRTVPFHTKQQPSAECLRYLETKIAEIEEVHCCTICMERRKNVVFLCGHSACDKCCTNLKICHMCRKTITKKIQLY
ncbi:E3 ubiquitin-protein ligase mind bomb 2 isoform X2 [Rhodnius prolixus]